MCEIKFKKICAGFIFLPSLALAQSQLQVSKKSAADDALQEQKQLIQDLIQSENQRLTQPTVARHAAQQPSMEKTSYTGADLILKAMYGVDNRVLAEISFRGKSYLYLRGQAWPIGDSKGQSQLRLLSMGSRCIHLAYKDEQFDACVLPQGGQP